MEALESCQVGFFAPENEWSDTARAHSMIDQDRKGNIINIIYTAGHQGEPGNVEYGTAKAGLFNFTRAVAIELSSYGIRVNSLTPTATDSSEEQEQAARWGVEWPVTRLWQRGCCRRAPAQAAEA